MIKIGTGVSVHPSAHIDVDYLEIGDYSVINKWCSIVGRSVILGKHTWMDERARIGGGRARMGTLTAGDYLHMGKNSEINTTRDVIIGDEVGIGMDTKIVTHGAYLNALSGFPYKTAPITIGSNVWLPFAWVMPGVTIGDNVVVGAMSLVNRDLPSNCLAGGVPVKILKKDYPDELSEEARTEVITDIMKEIVLNNIEVEYKEGDVFNVGNTKFFIKEGRISGQITKDTEDVRNILRRFGIRFRYEGDETGVYRAWG